MFPSWSQASAMALHPPTWGTLSNAQPLRDGLPWTREGASNGDHCPILSPHPSDPWPPCLSQASTIPQQALSGGFCPVVQNGRLYQEPSSLWWCVIPRRWSGCHGKHQPRCYLGAGAASPGARLGATAVCGAAWAGAGAHWLCPFLWGATRTGDELGPGL